ncbi:MAG: DUF1501 domain-containing protein [Flavobacteriales bacterium]|nr:DUF1501 domain-containing protein [Flavobacteriales bacterium]MCB9198572.1 DUF1501 domain-containing protein [Flavobacteriales bacterium]
MSQHKDLPKGSRIDDGSAHDEHHKQGIGRRDFIKNLGLLGAGTIAFSALPLNSLLASPLIQNALKSAGDRVLVIIRLKGGNDGLNTFVPVFDYGTYASYRPNLKIPTTDLLALNTMYSVPNYATSLKSLWDDGKMKVIQNVGYANPDLSHFTSTDIWDSSQMGQTDGSGWLGRYLWDQNPDFVTNPPTDPLALQIGGDGNLLFFNEDNLNMAMNVVDPVSLYQIAQTGSLYTVNGNAPCYYDDQLDFMKSMINSTYYQSQAINTAYNNGTNSVSFPAGLGESLSLVSRLIKGGLQTKIYMLTLDGFDTHAQQDTRHPDLLVEFGDSVKAFYDDLQAGNKDQDVLTMTFSEFGRRVNDNGSMGTDHGTAAPMMMFGPAVNGNGFVGNDVDLGDLDIYGNLKFTTDFREVYTTVLQDWMCMNELTSDTILGSSHTKLSLGFDCSSLGMDDIKTILNYHQLRYDNNKAFFFLNLPESSTVQLDVFDLTGKKVISTGNEYYSKGIYTMQIPGIDRLSSGAYAYRLHINGKLESGKLMKQ